MCDFHLGFKLIQFWLLQALFYLSVDLDLKSLF